MRTSITAVADGLAAGRIATAADVADAVSYVVSAEMVTGAILAVDGGLTVA